MEAGRKADELEVAYGLCKDNSVLKVRNVHLVALLVLEVIIRTRIIIRKYCIIHQRHQIQTSLLVIFLLF